MEYWNAVTIQSAPRPRGIRKLREHFGSLGLRALAPDAAIKPGSIGGWSKSRGRCLIGGKE
jgi:hypothetical protein